MKAILIYSGGLDSTTLLQEYRDSISLAVTFDYGSKHNAREIAFAVENCKRLGIRHMVIPLDFIGKYFRSDLLLSGGEIPTGEYAEDNMRSTVVPFRNGIMLAVAAGLAESYDLDTVLLANHSGDHSIYPDCRPEFIDAFDKAATRDEKFRNLAGSTAKVGMMHQTLDASYGENDFGQAVSLPYGNGKFVLTVYLPKKDDALATLPEADRLPRTGETCHVILSLPRFETENTVEMKDLLVAMGLPVGPYTELVENDTAVISQVIHKANITVNETGTEAAAVTVIEMKYTSAGPDPEPRTVKFTADHPFLYTISETTSGVILFTGLYNGG